MKVALGPALNLRRRLSKLHRFCIDTAGFEAEAKEFGHLLKKLK
jgi:hypothetical protein